MKTRKRILSGSFICIIATATIAAMFFIQQIQPIKASRNSETTFGIVSLNAGQTLRFNVVNPNNSSMQRVQFAFDIYSLGGPDTFSGSPDDATAVVVCTNNLRFVRRQTCEITLLPGEAISLNFPAPADGSQINAVMLGGPDTIGDPILVPTLEIRENNRTVFVHPGAARGFNPQPDPPRETMR
jgi:hypothetical protein